MTLTYTLLVVVQVFNTIKCSHLSLQGYTPLRINEIACTAEKLKVSKLTKTIFEGKLDNNLNLIAITRYYKIVKFFV